jgi:hypothetical protein
MKTMSITITLLILILTGFKKDTGLVKGYFDHMHFVRMGGGQIEFNLYKTDNSALKAVVTKFSFRDTTIQVIINPNKDNELAFSSFNKALNNQIQINGSFHQTTLPTGTWAFIYMVSGKKETEVTNTRLRNSLLKFEQLVSDKIQ